MAGTRLGQILGQDLHANLEGRQTHRRNRALLTPLAKRVELDRPTRLPVLLPAAFTLGDSRALGLALGLASGANPTLRLALGLPVGLAFGLAFGVVGGQLFKRLGDARRPRPGIDQLLRHLITAPIRAIEGILGGVGGRVLGRRRRGQLPHPALYVRLGLLGGGFAQPLLTAVRTQRRIRGDLHRIQRDHFQLAHPQPRTQHQHLGEQLGHRPGGPGTKPRDRHMIRPIPAADDPKRHIALT